MVEGTATRLRSHAYFGHGAGDLGSGWGPQFGDRDLVFERLGSGVDCGFDPSLAVWPKARDAVPSLSLSLHQ